MLNTKQNSTRCIFQWLHTKDLIFASIIIVFIWAHDFFHDTRQTQCIGLSRLHGDLGMSLLDPANQQGLSESCDRVTSLLLCKQGGQNGCSVQRIYDHSRLKWFHVGCRYPNTKLTISRQSRRDTESCETFST